MDFSKFFIDRPIFAAVLSIVILVAGLISMPLLPVSEYPEVVPPTVVVKATYPGANPKVIAETVSAPLEEQINGVEDMMYMKSVAGSDGTLQMTITFRPGTDPSKAQVDVQNRVSQALSRLPAEVVSLGVTTQKQSPAFLVLVTLISDGRYDALYLRNYANIRVKDQIVRLAGVAHIELGASDYTIRSQLDNYPTAILGVFQAPGANSLATRDAVIAKMQELSKRFPPGLTWRSDYDSTIFVRESIEAVVHTLLEAIALVVLVVILFLQTWRASIIPLIAVPVSVIGTFAVLYLLGFSINTLTLFGLVLAIRIVVDDAIVVVENIERNIAEGRTPLAAAHQAMKEVSGPIIAIALVLCAVFVPMAFLTGVTGTFYKQFAVTIAISTVISAINSLTLSPALAAKLLHSHDAPKDMLSRLIERLLGWFFRPFNRFFKASSNSYEGAVSRTLGRRGVVFIVYVIAGVKLPEGSSLERTDAVLQRMKDLALDTDGVAHVIGLTGFNPTQQTNTPNYAVAFPILKPFNERHRSAKEIAADIQAKIAQIKEGFAFVLNPPPVFRSELCRCLSDPEAVQRASPQRQGDRRRHPGQDRPDQGRLCLRAEPAAGPRSRPRRGLFAIRRRPCGRGLRRAPASGQHAANRGGEDARHGLSLRWLPVQRATT